MLYLFSQFCPIRELCYYVVLFNKTLNSAFIYGYIIELKNLEIDFPAERVQLHVWLN